MAKETTDNKVVLSVQNVKKKIKNKWIIKGISFEVKEGEIFGFLGPNGSGKTTTIRMLVDLIKPTEGTVFICGKSVHLEPDAALANVGCIVENPEMYGYLTGWDNLEQFARMLPSIRPGRIQEVVDIVGMDRRIHDKVKTYSLGMRQRLGIAQALLGSPKLLILDEPTNGLDPQGIKELRSFIRSLAAQGLSLFISSHLLSEIQLMCDRVAIISQGQVLAVDEVDKLVSRSAGKTVWRVEPVQEALELFRRDPETIHAEIASEGEYAGAILTQAGSDTLIPKLTEKLVGAGIRLYSIEPKNPTLEDLFLQITEGETIG